MSKSTASDGGGGGGLFFGRGDFVQLIEVPKQRLDDGTVSISFNNQGAEANLPLYKEYRPTSPLFALLPRICVSCIARNVPATADI